jgi:hypothetical protein
MKVRLAIVMAVLALAGTAAAAVTLTSPNGGEKWVIKGKSNITWTGTVPSGGNPNVRLVLRRFSQQADVGVIKSGLRLNDNSFNWTVGQLETAGTVKDGNDYFVCLVRAGNGEILDQSDHVFTICSPSGTFVEDIKITSPGNGDTFKPGAWIYLNWDKSNIANYPSVALGVYKADRTTYVGTVDGLSDPKKPNTGTIQIVVASTLYQVNQQYSFRVATPDDKHRGFSGVVRIIPLKTVAETHVYGAGIHWRERIRTGVSDWPGCLNKLGQAPLNPPEGQFPVGYSNHLDDPAGPCWAYVGAIYRTAFKFEQLKKGENILKAELQFTCVQGRSQTLHLHVLDSADDFGPMSLVATLHSWSLGKQISVDVTQAVKAWCAGQKNNYGFILQGPNEAYDHNNIEAITYINVPKLVVTENISK